MDVSLQFFVQIYIVPLSVYNHIFIDLCPYMGLPVAHINPKFTILGPFFDQKV